MASFIDTPPMNIIEIVVIEKSLPVLSLGKKRYKLARDYTLNFESVLLGARPEDIEIKPFSREGIEGIVEIVEPEGARFLIDLVFDGISLKAISDKRFSSGDKVFIEIPDEKIHLFTCDTGEWIEITYR